jgi:tRNA(fMet)-specific endonuclease VapC
LEDRRILIETSVIIDHFRKKNKQRSLLYELSKENKLFLSFNSNVADVASDIAKKLKAKNKIIEFRDIFIAATAIANDIPLSTLNVKHFERIDDLELR